MKNFISHFKVYTGLIVVIIIGIAVFAFFTLSSPRFDASLPHAEMVVHNRSFAVEIAATEDAWEIGLSGRSSLKSGTGMVFVFSKPGRWSIWMKDMNFPIDVVWLDKMGKVVTIKKYVAPETYPELFVPDADAWYILELPAGDTDRFLITEGDEFTLPQLQ